MQLWNISTKKKIFEFKGWGSPISCCVSSPALDVVAVGCADGKIHVHNIRYDEELVTFTHSTRGSVTALSFSTGRTEQHSHSLIHHTCGMQYFCCTYYISLLVICLLIVFLMLHEIMFVIYLLKLKGLIVFRISIGF